VIWFVVVVVVVVVVSMSVAIARMVDLGVAAEKKLSFEIFDERVLPLLIKKSSKVKEKENAGDLLSDEEVLRKVGLRFWRSATL
jgi:hypothetical protein